MPQYLNSGKKIEEEENSVAEVLEQNVKLPSPDSEGSLIEAEKSFV